MRHCCFITVCLIIAIVFSALTDTDIMVFSSNNALVWAAVNFLFFFKEKKVYFFGSDVFSILSRFSQSSSDFSWLCVQCDHVAFSMDTSG